MSSSPNSLCEKSFFFEMSFYFTCPHCPFLQLLSLLIHCRRTIVSKRKVASVYVRWLCWFSRFSPGRTRTRERVWNYWFSRFSPAPTHPCICACAMDLLIQQILVRACPAAKFKMRNVAHGASAINSVFLSRKFNVRWSVKDGHSARVVRVWRRASVDWPVLPRRSRTSPGLR